MISIVIVTHNSEAHIRSCLWSVKAQQQEGVREIIIVDNASDDLTVKIIRQFCPEAVLIVNAENKGAAQARNQSIERARGEWVLTLDSDVVLEAGFVKTFLERQGGLPDDVGMVQSNILSMDHARVYSQGILLSMIRRFADANRGRPVASCRHAQGIIGPCAAAAFYRRDMLEQLKEVTGYFDQRFFFLVEDVDLAWRARKRGWKVVFMPEICCGHEGGGAGTGTLRRRYLCWRNRHLMIAKNESFFGKVCVYFMGAPYEAARLVYMLFNWMRVKRD